MNKNICYFALSMLFPMVICHGMIENSPLCDKVYESMRNCYRKSNVQWPHSGEHVITQNVIEVFARDIQKWISLDDTPETLVIALRKTSMDVCESSSIEEKSSKKQLAMSRWSRVLASIRGGVIGCQSKHSVHDFDVQDKLLKGVIAYIRLSNNTQKLEHLSTIVLNCYDKLPELATETDLLVTPGTQQHASFEALLTIAYLWKKSEPAGWFYSAPEVKVPNIVSPELVIRESDPESVGWLGWLLGSGTSSTTQPTSIKQSSLIQSSVQQETLK